MPVDCVFTVVFAAVVLVAVLEADVVFVVAWVPTVAFAVLVVGAFAVVDVFVAAFAFVADEVVVLACVVFVEAPAVLVFAELALEDFTSFCFGVEVAVLLVVEAVPASGSLVA